MTAETKILTVEQIDALWKTAKGGAFKPSPFALSDFARAIEQAVLQSPEVQAMRWQPIETAPKDTEVLVWREDSGPFIAKFTDPYEVITVEEMERDGLEFPDDFEEWWSDAYGWQEGSERPTHWMPLPPPPAPIPKEPT